MVTTSRRGGSAQLLPSDEVSTHPKSQDYPGPRAPPDPPSAVSPGHGSASRSSYRSTCGDSPGAPSAYPRRCAPLDPRARHGIAAPAPRGASSRGHGVPKERTEGLAVGARAGEAVRLALGISCRGQRQGDTRAEVVARRQQERMDTGVCGLPQGWWQAPQGWGSRSRRAARPLHARGPPPQSRPDTPMRPWRPTAGSWPLAPRWGSSALARDGSLQSLAGAGRPRRIVAVPPDGQGHERPLQIRPPRHIRAPSPGQPVFESVEETTRGDDVV